MPFAVSIYLSFSHSLSLSPAFPFVLFVSFWTRVRAPLCQRRVCSFGGDIQTRQEGSTVLVMAAANGRADCVRLLIDAGADMEAKDKVLLRSLIC